MNGTLEYRIASCGEKYRPEFRRSRAERWWFMRNMSFPNATAAKAAADHIVELDEASRAPAHVIEVEPSPFESHAEWRREKDAALTAERQRLFGDKAITSKAFVEGRFVKSAPPKVERVGRRARA